MKWAPKVEAHPGCWGVVFPGGGTAICESSRTAKAWVRADPGTTIVRLVPADPRRDAVVKAAAALARMTRLLDAVSRLQKARK